ncbi:MAG: AmpD protein [Pseudohongiellaceae bacterium]|jgi:AmpD protein
MTSMNGCLNNWQGGWLNGVKQMPSPNYNARPEASKVNLLVIHNISLPPGQFGSPYIEQFFQNKLSWDEHSYFKTIEGLEVSAHFLIKQKGELVQFVSCHDRAWHAGASSFCGKDNCNDYSIGIELEGTDTAPYTDAQYLALVTLTKQLQLAFPEISASRIKGHLDIAPGRKTDPGESFDWPRYLNALCI